MTSNEFRVGLSAGFRTPDGRPAYGDIGLDALSHVSWEFLPDNGMRLDPAVAAHFDALLLLTTEVTAATLAGGDRLSLIARFGVGYDLMDIDACTKAGVAVTLTPDAVRRPVALGAYTLLLALAHRVVAKDQLVRSGRWAERGEYLGAGFAGRTLGMVGFGNIGREVVRLAAPLGLRVLAHDPYADLTVATAAGVHLVDSATLLREADFVVLTCSLTPQTFHFLNRTSLALLKPHALIVNVARGAVVDTEALTEALLTGQVGGAALDVFETEPPPLDDPLLGLDNVIVTPHAIAGTQDLGHGVGRSAIASIVEVAGGRVPAHVLNRAVLDHPGFVRKLDGYTARAGG